MKYCYTTPKFTTLTLDQAKRIFPKNFSFQEESEQFLIIIESNEESEESTFNQLQQELDRIFLLQEKKLCQCLNGKRILME